MLALAENPTFTSPLPTGVRLDAVGDAVGLGSMPLDIVPAHGGDKAVVVPSGWREQAIQIVDLKTRQVTQTLLQDSAFYGAAFSPDGNTLYVSGGNTDTIFVYTTGNQDFAVGEQRCPVIVPRTKQAVCPPRLSGIGLYETCGEVACAASLC